MVQMPITGATDRVGQPAPPDDKKLRETIGKVVGSVFYGTLLRAMRDSTIQGKYGHGGRGEEIFSAQLHDILAERMGTATKTGLNEGIYRSLSRPTTAAAPSGSMQERSE